MMVRTIAVALLLAAPAAAQVSPARPDSTTRPTTDSSQMARTGMTPSGALLTRDSTRRDTAITPKLDQARGTDAEIRVALYELMGDRYIPALSRLQALQASPVALSSDASAQGALRGRNDLLFLLAESYYRLGMDQAFRTAAQTLMGGSAASRYAGILRAQLLLDAYRHGDYPRAIEMARALAQTETRGLASLVAGLAQYQTRAYADARTSFATAQQAGAPYAAYAQYMDALTQLRSDTSQAGPALQALTAVASSATGEFADQVRLTAAQLAYESEQYDQAVTLASAIQPTSGLGAQAMLTRAWALYKANQVGPAGEAFAEFARRYPELPERDEARLMSAQALLQIGRTEEAARAFRSVADSVGAETRVMQARTGGTMTQAARALVQARAAGLLFITDPASGKTVALSDAAGADASVLAAAVSDTAVTAPAVGAPEVVSLADVSARVNALTGPLGTAFPQRVLFTQTSATANRADYAARSQALYDADVAVALAQFRVQAALDAQARQLAMLQALQQQIGGDANGFGALAAQLTAAQDSLARLASRLDATANRVRQLFMAQINTTRLMASENAALIDSTRQQLNTAAGTSEDTLFTIEAQTANTYRQLADLLESGLGTAISHHPVFALRDSVRGRGERMRSLLAETQGILASTQQTLSAEIARLQATDAAAALRGQLASAEATRATAETQLVAVVDRELSARAGELLADLRRDTEAAEFGSASATFFQALDAGKAAGTNGSSSGSASSATGARNTPVASTLPPK